MYDYVNMGVYDYVGWKLLLSMVNTLKTVLGCERRQIGTI